MAVSRGLESLLQEAAKFYAAKDYEASTDLYSELNELYYALRDENNADYMYLYGKSLYQLAMSKSEVFAVDPTEGDVEEEDDDEGDATAKKNLFQFNETLAEGDGPGDEKESKQEEEEEDGANDDAGPNEEEEINTAEPRDDFESAWEILELTRAMFKSQGSNPENVQKLSETLDLLGEISLETANFAQAVDDFRECLQLRENVYGAEDPTHRLIIESHYKLSLALEFDPTQTESCKMHLKSAAELLDKRIQDNRAEDGDEDLVKELRLKLQDLDTTPDPLAMLKKEGLTQLKHAMAQTGAGSSSSAQTAPVNDLTAMVKKRKPKCDPVGKENPKKPK
ncbi:LAMI_0H13168g1_1 [Lachancea mirantina]|uniref:LAMI_0H13168g1_1 n=1 Tax=Lachancea mirantina TaxID=1230905 RepID=A0A1G4KHY2_9SACH|nr:LAMI_0H13168g1_1 [Lachancea mirantina]